MMLTSMHLTFITCQRTFFLRFCPLVDRLKVCSYKQDPFSRVSRVSFHAVLLTREQIIRVYPSHHRQSRSSSFYGASDTVIASSLPRWPLSWEQTIRCRSSSQRVFGRNFGALKLRYLTRRKFLCKPSKSTSEVLSPPHGWKYQGKLITILRAGKNARSGKHFALIFRS